MIPLPSVSDVIASTTPVASTTFTNFQGVIWFVLGVIIGVLVVGFVISVFGKAVKALIKRRRH